ncbi:Hemicentin-1 [Durusdinium trenchii]|uniref:Hemicentin-1 n=1 Tax=Durusdinium trenchii TaxID=1381693 RepID=A0ABP0K4I8_9DINO
MLKQHPQRQAKTVCEKTDLTSDALFEHNPEDSATYKEEFLLLERSAALEASEVIPQGSTSKLRALSRVFKRHEPYSVAQLANAMSPALPLDKFLPTSDPPQGARALDDILKKPTLIPTCDQEPKQIKWLHRMAYQAKLRMLLKRDEHHRLQNDSIAAPKQCQIWGAVAATKLCMSVLKKPFDSYDAQQQLGTLALSYLEMHGPHSEEFQVDLADMRSDLGLDAAAPAEHVHGVLVSTMTSFLKPSEVSLSRFFSWNIRFAGWRRFWTFLRKLLDFRATVMGKVDIDQENAEAPSENAAAAAGQNVNRKDKLLALLRELQSQKGTLDVVHEVLRDVQMKHYATQIYYSQVAMREEHLALQADTKTREGNRAVQASWAAGGWASCVGKTLAFLSDSAAMERLGFFDEEAFTDCDTYFALIVAAASQRAWNMSLWSQLAPYQWASVLHEDLEMAQQGLERMKADSDVVQQAWRAVEHPAADVEGLSKILDHLWIHKLTLVNETWAHACAHGWQVDSVFAHIFFCFDTLVSTKECLEDVLGSLKSLAKNSNSNPFKAASPERLFLQNVLSVRWDPTEFPLLRVQPGDMGSKSFYETSTARQTVFLPRKFKSNPCKVVEQVHEAVKAESSGLLTEPMAGQQSHVQAVKPAGQEADWRSVAAITALRCLASTSFVDASAVWCTAALERGKLFQEKLADDCLGKVYLSLGFHFSAAILWEVEEVQPELYQLAADGLTAGSSNARVRYVCLTTMTVDGREEAFEGIPVDICPPLAHGHKNLGILLRRSGANLPLSKFFLLHGSLQNVDDKFLHKLVLCLGLTPKKYKETRVGNKSWAMTLIQSLFPEMTEEEQEKLLLRLLDTTTRKGLLSNKTLHSVFEVLDRGDEDMKLFADLQRQVADVWRTEYVISRVGRAKAAAEAMTPVLIKQLKPPGPKVYLAWQVSMSCFEGYYPRPALEKVAGKGGAQNRRKTHFSTSRTYGGARTSNRTQEAALQLVVQFLWGHHKKQGGDMTGKPSKQDILDALQKCTQEPDACLATEADLKEIDAAKRGEEANDMNPTESPAKKAKRDKPDTCLPSSEEDPSPSPEPQSESSSSSSSESSSPKAMSSTAKPKKRQSHKKKGETHKSVKKDKKTPAKGAKTSTETARGKDKSSSKTASTHSKKQPATAAAKPKARTTRIDTSNVAIPNFMRR